MNLFEKPQKDFIKVRAGEIWFLKDDKMDRSKDGPSHPYFALNVSAENDECDRVMFMPISHGFTAEMPFFTIDRNGEYNLCYINPRTINTVTKDALQYASYSGYKFNDEMIMFLQDLVIDNLHGDWQGYKNRIEAYKKEYLERFKTFPKTKETPILQFPEAPKPVTPLVVSAVTTAGTTIQTERKPSERHIETDPPKTPRQTENKIPDEIYQAIIEGRISTAEAARQVNMTYWQARHEVLTRSGLGNLRSKADEKPPENPTIYELKAAFEDKVHRSKEYACARGISEKKNIFFKEVGRDLNQINVDPKKESVKNLTRFIYAVRRYDRNIVAACYGMSDAEIENKFKIIKEYVYHLCDLIDEEKAAKEAAKSNS